MTAQTTEKTARKSVQVSTTVSAEVFDALEDYRWTARKKMTELVAEAVTDLLAKHKIAVAGTAAPAEDAKPSK